MNPSIRAYDALVRLLGWACAAMLASTVILTVIQVFFRYVVGDPLSWSEELARWLFVWTVYLGWPLLISKKKHMRLEFLLGRVGPAQAERINMLSQVVVAAACWAMMFHGWDFCSRVTGTSGSLEWPSKYLYMAVPVSAAISLIVLAALTAVRGAYHHIGPLDDGWVKEIRQHLGAHAIDPSRFVHHGLVPSLWDHLKALDAAVYIGSAPIGGGRAAIEAQGCGYPLAYFESAQAYGLADNEGLYATRSLKWATPDELASVLASVGSSHKELSRQARQLYLDTHSHRQFKQALKQLLQG